MKQSLNFSWSFIKGYDPSYLTKLDEKALEVNIPHNPVEIPYNYFSEKIYQDLFTYEKVFDVEPELGLVCDFHRHFSFEILFTPLGIVFVAIV